MIVGVGFIVRDLPPGTICGHTLLLPGDIQKLKGLFRHNSIWNARTRDDHGIFYFCPTWEESLDFYRALTDYVALESPSAELYPAGGMPGLGILHNSLKSVFETLISFFKRELGLAGEIPAR